jgi:hypothetical protein
MKNIILAIYFIYYRITPILLCVVGIGLLYFGNVNIQKLRAVLNNPIITQGTIIGFDKGTLRRRPLLITRIKFLTVNGEEVQFTSRVANILSYKINQQLSIIYDQSNPNNAYINTFLDKYVSIILFIVTGIAFIGVGVTSLSFTSKNKLIKTII